MRWNKAIVLNPIYWHNIPYLPGDSIRLTDEEVEHLRAADVIGDITIATPFDDKEFAINEAPENAMISHKRRTRKKSSRY